MKLKKFFPLFLISGLVSLSFSCGEKKETREDNSSELLFEKSVALIKDYNGRIKGASDSLTVDSLTETFEKQLTDLNFSVPPQTDMKLTEQQNDSLATLLFQLEDIRKEKLRSLSKRNIQEADSIKEKNP